VRPIYRWTLTAGLAGGLLAGFGVWARAQGGDNSAALERARRSSCQANMKQLSLGLIMYAQDYDQHFPPAARWSKATLPYIKNPAIYVCPSDGGSKNSFALNRNVSGRALKTIKQLASMPLLFESNQHVPNASGLAAQVASPPRHGGGNNFAWVDGRVTWESKTPGFGAPYVAAKRKGR
jgi:prepilin-type processing-associated H-X9-DG protein